MQSYVVLVVYTAGENDYMVMANLVVFCGCCLVGGWLADELPTWALTAIGIVAVLLVLF